jgi:hypothetical protein
VRRLSTEKEEEESTASGSGSSNVKDEEKDEHWHRLGEEHKHSPRVGLVKLYHQTESEEVREWEARIKKDREEAKRKNEEEKQHDREHGNEKVNDETKPH